MSQVMNHIRPIYYGHEIGEFASVGTCRNCGRTSLREDFHPAHPCPSCGASDKHREWFAAKWVWQYRVGTPTWYWPWTTKEKIGGQWVRSEFGGPP